MGLKWSRIIIQDIDILIIYKIFVYMSINIIYNIDIYYKYVYNRYIMR